MPGLTCSLATGGLSICLAPKLRVLPEVRLRPPPCGNRPNMAKGIDHLTVSIAPKEVLRLHADGRSRAHCSLKEGVGVLAIDLEGDGRAAQLLRRARPGSRKLVDHKEVAVAEPEVAVDDRRAVGSPVDGDDLAAEGVLVELQCLGRPMDGQR